MDGSYSNAYKAGMSPLNPDAAISPSSYRANVNRQKTKKWVEAKAQNYDGDDWGNDYDDEPDEEEHAPIPLRPTVLPSPVQVSASSSFPSPSVAQSPGEPGVGSPRSLSGPPPSLHIETQQPLTSNRPVVSGPSTIGSASERQHSEQVVSPQSQSTTNLNLSSPSSAVPGRSDYSQNSSPVAARRMSPAPQSAGGPRFPPRKSSIGPQEIIEVAQPGSGSRPESRPGSSPRPWSEAQSASPPGARAGTPTRALPFVRPAEIYKRMEEEKDKVRRSMESGRASTDSMAGRGSDGSASPAKSPQDPAERAFRRGSLGKDEAGDSTRSSRPILATVAEGKSEYGLGRILATNEPHVQKSTLAQAAPASPVSNQPPPAVTKPAPAEAMEEDTVSDLKPSEKRFSTSPKLPDVARMSGFGDDIFANPSKFLANPPLRPPLSDKPVPTSKFAKKPIEKADTPMLSSLSPQSSAAEGVAKEAGTPPTGALGQDAPNASPTSLPVRAEKAPSSMGNASSSERDSARLATSPPPNLPGRWTSDTSSSFWSQSPRKLDTIQSTVTTLDAGEVSPISETDANAHDAEPDNLGQERRDEVQRISNADVLMDKDGVSDLGNKPAAPSLPPLSTEDSKHPSQSGEPRSATPQLSAKATESTRTVSPATSGREPDIIPTAPLKPQPSNTNPEDFAPPDVLQREPTISSIDTSSPIKESDKLRKEIIESLSPVRHTPPEDPKSFGERGESAAVDTNGGGRESSYLPGVYDEYWSTSDDKRESKQQGPTPMSQAAPARSSSLETIPHVTRPEPEPEVQQTETEATKPKRFSWEMGSEPDLEPPVQHSDGTTAAIATPPPEISTSDPHHAVSAQAYPASGEPSPPSTNLEPAALIAPATEMVSHQEPQASAIPAGQKEDSTPEPEPSSPTSDEDDKSFDLAAGQRRVSLAEEKGLIENTAKPVTVTASPPREQHPALADPTGTLPAPGTTTVGQPQTVNVLSFKEIMALPTSVDRAKKYDETRAHFAAMESGLDNWMATLRAQYPEHANASAFFVMPALASPTGVPGAPLSPAGMQQAPQQPYYQQYLNASSPNATTPTFNRTPKSYMPAGSQSPSSDFKHSSNQMGTRGKELLKSAGKAGKGLLSKGKNKLRGSGEKNDSSPPPSQPKLKNERRTSWGISLGPRSSPRADGPPAPHVSGDIKDHVAVAATSTPPPHLPPPSRVSPFHALSEGGNDSAWPLPQPPQTPKNRDFSQPVSPVSEAQSGPPLKDEEASPENKFRASAPISKNHSSWDPLTGTPAGEEQFNLTEPRPGGLDACPAVSVVPEHAKLSAVGITNDTAAERLDEWVVVPSQQPAGGVGMEPPASPTPSERSVGAQQATAESKITSEAPVGENQDTPQRHTSFIGLPPIRRSSTFGVNLAERANRRFLLEEDEEEVPPAPTDTAEVSSQLRDPSLPIPGTEQRSDAVADPAIAAPSETQALQPDIALTSPVPPGAPPAHAPNPGAGEVQQTQGLPPPIDQRAPQSMASPGALTLLSQPPPQDPQPLGQDPSFPSHVSPQPAVVSDGNPIQRLPPQGPWKLEESHLSAPLQPVTRRRSPSNLSQQDPVSGIDKETGVLTPFAPPVPAPAQAPPRQRGSEPPPLSAQRYPGLFIPPAQHQSEPPQPQGRASSDLTNDYYARENAVLRRSQTMEYEIPGVGPPAADEKKSKRSSGLFKEIGGRLRLNSVTGSEPRSQGAGSDILTGDEASESSIATAELQDRSKKRNSFFASIRGGSANEIAPPQSRESMVVHSPSTVASPSPAPPPSEKKRSFFGSALGGQTSQLKKPSLSRSSTGSIGQDSNASGAPTGPVKKRFSGLTGMFNRPSTQQGTAQKPGTAHSAAQPFQGQPGIGGPASPARGRSSTTGSRPYTAIGPGSQPQPGAGVEENRGKRTSVSTGGFLSGLLGSRTASKTRDPKPAPAPMMAPPNQPQNFAPGQPPMMTSVNRPQSFPLGQQPMMAPANQLQSFSPGQQPMMAPANQLQSFPPGQLLMMAPVNQPRSFPPGQLLMMAPANQPRSFPPGQQPIMAPANQLQSFPPGQLPMLPGQFSGPRPMADRPIPGQPFIPQQMAFNGQVPPGTPTSRTGGLPQFQAAPVSGQGGMVVMPPPTGTHMPGEHPQDSVGAVRPAITQQSPQGVVEGPRPIGNLLRQQPQTQVGEVRPGIMPQHSSRSSIDQQLSPGHDRRPSQSSPLAQVQNQPRLSPQQSNSQTTAPPPAGLRKQEGAVNVNLEKSPPQQQEDLPRDVPAGQPPDQAETPSAKPAQDRAESQLSQTSPDAAQEDDGQQTPKVRTEDVVKTEATSDVPKGPPASPDQAQKDRRQAALSVQSLPQEQSPPLSTHSPTISSIGHDRRVSNQSILSPQPQHVLAFQQQGLASVRITSTSPSQLKTPQVQLSGQDRRLSGQTAASGPSSIPQASLQQPSGPADAQYRMPSALGRSQTPTQASSASPHQTLQPFIPGQPGSQPGTPITQGSANSTSRWFRTGPSAQGPPPAPQPQAKPAKKSLFDAFRRSSKQPEPPRQQPTGPPGQPMQGVQMQGMPGPQGQQSPFPALPQQMGQNPQGQLIPQGQLHPAGGFPGTQGRMGPSPPAAHPASVPAQQSPSIQGQPQQGGQGSQQMGGPQTRRPQTVGPQIRRTSPGRSSIQQQPEPQYDQVPIPRGYAAVRGEGTATPSPYIVRGVGPREQPGQLAQFHYPAHQGHQWNNPGMMPQQTAMFSGQFKPQYMSPGSVGIPPQTTPQNASPGVGIRHVGTTSNSNQLNQTPPPGAMTPTGNGGPQGQMAASERMTSDGSTNAAVPPPQLRYQGTPPPVNQQTTLTTPPPPKQPGLLQVSPGPNDNVTPQRHASDVSYTSTQLSNPGQPQGTVRPLADSSAGNSMTKPEVQDVSTSSRATERRNLTPGPPNAPTTSNLSVNTAKANEGGRDDIYDATPRASAVPPDDKASKDEASKDKAAKDSPPAPVDANGSAKSAIPRGKSSQAEPESTEEERKRNLRLETQEEKIPVHEDNEPPGMGAKGGDDDDDGDVPQMSATSYPGQEWNPYGMGLYGIGTDDDWNEQGD